MCGEGSVAGVMYNRGVPAGTFMLPGIAAVATWVIVLSSLGLVMRGLHRG